MAHYNDIRDKLADLAVKSFTTTHVRENPLIFAGRAVQRPKAHMAGTTPSSLKRIIQRPRNRSATY